MTAVPWKGTRSRNIQLVLGLLKTDGPASQASIAQRTGLSRATVNNIVQALRREGVADIRWINGREALVTLVATQGTVLSVQVSVDSLHGAAFTFASGKRIDVQERTGPVNDQSISRPEMALDLVRTLAGRAGVEVAQLAGVSLAMQAPIDRLSGVIASWASERLPHWQGVPVAQMLREALGVPVVVDNDANLAALAEWTWGAGRGADDFLYLACSDQVGSGLMIGGKVYRGGDGMAGEIGHMVLDPAGSVCFCGNRGCLSTYVSEHAILLELQSSGRPQRSLREVVGRAQRGDPACQRVLFETGRRLGQALANTAKVIAPSVVVIGGLLVDAETFVFEGLYSSVEINNLRAVSPSIQFRSGQFAEDATLLGGVAALLADLDQGVSELPSWMRATDVRADAPSTGELVRGTF